jgi:hypothetical protein
VRLAQGTPNTVDGDKTEVYKDDWLLLEGLRRQAAHRLMGMVAEN